MSPEIEDLVKTHIETELMSNRDVTLGFDTDLVGIVDSAGVLELAMWTENAFGFTVDFDEISPEDFGTIRRVSAWIRRNVERQSGTG